MSPPGALVRVTVMKSKLPQSGQRQHERVPAAMPVSLGALGGVTRDISVGGMYLEVDQAGELGSQISFSVQMDTSVGRLLLRCVGEVVRRDDKGGRVGVGVKVVDSHLESLGPVAPAAEQ